MQSAIKISGRLLKPHKIVQAVIRSSPWWAARYYILDIEYSRRWKSTFYIGQNFLIPFEIHHDTVDYRFRFDDLLSLNATVSLLKEHGVDVNKYTRVQSCG